MKRADCRPLWYVIHIAILACLGWLAVGAGAATVIPGANLTASAAANSMGGGHAMPPPLQRSPCAVCCIASAPSLHGASGQGKPPQQQQPWRVCNAGALRRVASFGKEGRRCRLPVRIVFCRWLN
jgi:hypothetical protein